MSLRNIKSLFLSIKRNSVANSQCGREDYHELKRHGRAKRGKETVFLNFKGAS